LSVSMTETVFALLVRHIGGVGTGQGVAAARAGRGLREKQAIRRHMRDISAVIAICTWFSGPIDAEAYRGSET